MSQCHTGEVGEGYSTSAAHLGAILCGDMTTPAVFAKVSCILAEVKNKEEVAKRLLKDTRGEVTDKEYSHAGGEGGLVGFFEGKLQRYLKSESQVTAVLAPLLQSLAVDVVKKNRVKLLGELLRYDSRLLAASSFEGFHVLHSLSVSYQRKVLALLLCQRDAADLLSRLANQGTIYGDSPLDFAIKMRCAPVIDDLKRLGAHFDEENMLPTTVADIIE